MRTTKLLLSCLCCLALATAAWAQTENAQSKLGILGYLDPKTGAFRPVPQASDDAIEPAATLTTFGGTITVTLTITVKSTGLTTVTCLAGTDVTDALTSGSPRSYAESVTAVATGSGATRTCKLTIPYSWALATQASDSMSTTYGVFGTAGSTSPVNRTSGLTPLDTRKVPANGATTALTASVTI